MIIRRKIWPEFFEKVLKGKKTAEIRWADFYSPEEIKNFEVYLVELK